MNLDTITEVKHPASADEIRQWRDGYAWLAGGTWLFSELQPAVHTLIDLHQLKWPALQASAEGLEIAATCRIAELYEFAGPAEWRALPLIKECCNSFLASFKIWNAATIGGNICMSLPAGPMISLTSALEGRLTLWPRSGEPRQVAVADFVTGNHANVLQPGELIRSVHLPASALAEAFRLPPCLSDPSRPVGGADHRDPIGRGRASDHHHGGHAASDPAALRFAALGQGAARCHRCDASRRRLFQRCAWQRRL